MKKIAIVHEWLTTLGGSEKVIEQLLHLYPQADLFSVVDFLPEKERAILGGVQVHSTFLQKAPFLNAQNYRNYLVFMPLAIEQLDLAAYDLVISNCHAVSKGVITGPEQLHISYVHTPLRYAWDMQSEYLQGVGAIKGALARVLLHYIRAWDALAANRPDVMIANSGFIARRIRKIYRREVQVIYPPVDVDYFTPLGARDDFYFSASRLVPYKHIDLIVEAFREMPEKKLVIIGDGPEHARIQARLTDNIQLLGYQEMSVLRDHLRRCRAFIFAAKEDFGIMPLEAQACGAPVIAFGEGGATETVRGAGSQGQTGLFFNTQSAQALRLAVLEFESQHILAEDCRANAERFSNQRFAREFGDFVNTAWNEFQKRG